MEKKGKGGDHKRADKDPLINRSKEESTELSEDELGQVSGGLTPPPPSAPKPPRL